MHDILIPVGIFIMVLVVAAIWGLVNQRNARRVNDAWGRLAQQTGLELAPANLARFAVLTGYHRHHWVRIFKVEAGRYGSGSYTFVEVSLSQPTGFTMQVTAANCYPILNAFLKPEITTGDPAFDQAYLLNSNDHSQLQKILINDVRQALLCLGETRALTVEGRIVRLEQRGVQLDTQRLHYTLDVVVNLAAMIDSVSVWGVATPWSST